MKDKDHVNILSDFFPKFLLKKLEKIGVEKPIFSDGGGNPPPPGTQRVKAKLINYSTSFQLFLKQNLLLRGVCF